ncbi:transposase [Mesorhizobium sp. M0598]
MSHHRTFEILTAEPVPSRRKPRHRSDEEKARLVAEAFSPGGNVSAVARSEGLNACPSGGPAPSSVAR